MKNLSLNSKIVGILSIFVVACIVIGVVGLMKVGEINETLNQLVNVTSKRLTLAIQTDSVTNEIKNQEKRFILEDTEEGMKAVNDTLNAREAEALAMIEEMRSMQSENGAPLIAEITTKMAAWKKISTEMRGLSLVGKNKEAFALARGPSKDTFDQIDANLVKLMELNQAVMKRESQAANDLVAKTRTLILSVSVIALLIGCVLAFFILRSVNKAIEAVITNLDNSSDQVASAAQQIASSSEQLSQSTTEQAASLEQTASAVEEMNSMIGKNSENARKSSSTATKGQQTAQKGKDTVDQMIRSIADINDANNNIMQQINHSNQQIAEIVTVIGDIGNKTKVINDIVFQTKLLSFNASVEAARAGEHGKGFAVVAEEVGNLAQMSGNAAKEISAMLEGSIQKVEGIVNETKTSVERLVAEGKAKVETGTRIAHECGSVLDAIVSDISSVTEMSSEISSASQEQAQGISEITKAMAQLDQVTQQNSASSEEAASAAEELSAQAETLKHGVQVLMETIRGGGKAGSTAAPAATTERKQRFERPAKVVAMQKKRSAPAAAAPVSLKKASGDDSAPSYKDQRFEDV